MKLKMIRIGLLAAVFAAVVSVRLAGAAAAGGQPGAIFSYGAGGRGDGMGRAYAAVADDATAGIWNPAGLVQLDRDEVYVQHIVLFEQTGYEFLSYAYPTLNYGAFGASLIYQHSSGFEVTNPDTVGVTPGAEFSTKDLVLMASYAYPIWPDLLSLGTNIKYYSNTVLTDTSSFLVWDLGLMTWPANHLRLGLNLQNLISFKLGGDTSDTIPAVIRVGASYKLVHDQLLISTDLDTQGTRIRANWYLGAEYKIFDVRQNPPYQIALRVGTNYEEVITFGLGISYHDYSIDYAFSSQNQQGSSHRFSASARLGESLMIARAKQDEEQQLARREQANELYKSAEADSRNGLYALASEKISRALELDPGLNVARRFKDAVDLVAPIMPKANADDKTSRLSRQAMTHLFDNDPATSVSILEYLLSLDPYGPDNEKLLRLAKSISQKYGVDFKGTPSPLTMNFVEKNLYEALGCFYEGRYDKVIELCQKVIEIEPANITALMRLGSGYYAIGQKVKAQELWNKALQLDPQNKELEFFIQKVKKEIVPVGQQ